MKYSPEILGTNGNLYSHGAFNRSAVSPAVSETAYTAYTLYYIYHLGIILFFHKLFQAPMDKSDRRNRLHHRFIFDYQVEMNRLREAPDAAVPKGIIVFFPILITFLSYFFGFHGVGSDTLKKLPW